MPKVLSEMIADDILYMINVEKRFSETMKLPNENDFAKELNVNRATLREAIRILVTNGVLEIRRGVGTFIKENAAGDVYKRQAYTRPWRNNGQV